ncbi:MAG: SAM-dependent methyltransferase [Rhodospirillaceae bacterium]|nr:MAG: SAM-dependent methyltransferase [Rhodospirillaceae bacterium]
MAENNTTDFIDRWKASSASELGNSQSFLNELCDLIGVERPHPKSDDERQNVYTFERGITFKHSDGSETPGRIDLYKRGCFVLESKQGSNQKDVSKTPLWSGQGSTAGKQKSKTKKGTAVRGTRGWSDAMVRARSQAERYAKSLPTPDGWPPFLIIVDVGHSIELFADFSLTGKNYSHYPDKATFRIWMDDLEREDVRTRLNTVWTDPTSLDPTKISDKVTREIADMLAALAKSLEETGHAPQSVATFLMRCLFTMFAEDVGLLPPDCFTNLMERHLDKADKFHRVAEVLWKDMDKGTDYSHALETDIKRFNGGLFKDASAIKLNEEQLLLLLNAARADWCDVEPAIFGTLLERALESRERHKLGAHYTPRAYVERLVMPTVIEPLRYDFDNVKAAAVQLANAGNEKEALKLVREFHQSLCDTTVLDPACGSGNFLYVTMEHMKRLEGEVLDLAEELGQDQYFLEMDQHTVDPHQFIGLEINPRAVPIAELVLWIGYLQWHFKVRGKTMPAQPVLKNFNNIHEQDALIDYSGKELVTDEHAKPITRWDGRTTKTHPTTGKQVPDETAREPVYQYKKPKPSTWPKADFIVGNPPFLGGKDIKDTMGEGYQEALWSAYKEKDVPRSADFVMYWWHKAAQLTRLNKVRRFGFITTNSITQTFSRRVAERHMAEKKALSLVYAVSDHPWVDAAQCAAVRIAMSVGAPGNRLGRLATVTQEIKADDGMSHDVELDVRLGKIHANLKIGADLTSAISLKANEKLSSRGVSLHGSGFIVTPAVAKDLGLGTVKGLDQHIRSYRNGRDIAGKSRGVMVIDLFGFNDAEVRKQFPKVYQHVVDNVKPERDQNNRATYRKNWWVFGEPRKDFRPALKGLPRFIATVETAKHRVFQFLDISILPDNRLVNFALSDGWFIGILSSKIHVIWSLATGGRLEDRPIYTKTQCFDPFPFPDATDSQKDLIRDFGEELDAHRKRIQAEHADITITDMYNVLEKIKADDELNDAEKDIHERGLVSVLKDLHERVDAAVFAAYGWDTSLSEEAILENLVTLNHERVKEENQGQVKWLRPEYQAPDEADAATAVQETFDVGEGVAVQGKKQPWPKTLPEQFDVVRAVIQAAETPLRAEEVARTFTRANKNKVGEVLSTLEGLSQIHRVGTERFAA